MRVLPICVCFATAFTGLAAMPPDAVSAAQRQRETTTNPVAISINNMSVTPAFAGETGAGLYQINITIPPGLGTGDVTLQASVGGAKTPAVVISLQ